MGTKTLTPTQIGILRSLASGRYELRCYWEDRRTWTIGGTDPEYKIRPGSVLATTVRVLAERGLVADLPKRYEGDKAIRVSITEAGREFLATLPTRS